jgi:hypothetical protein
MMIAMLPQQQDKWLRLIRRAASVRRGAHVGPDIAHLLARGPESLGMDQSRSEHGH